MIFRRPNKNLLEYTSKDYSKLKFKEYHQDTHNLMNIIEYDDLIKII